MFPLQEMSRTYHQVDLLISNANARQIAQYSRRDIAGVFGKVKDKTLEERVWISLAS